MTYEQSLKNIELLKNFASPIEGYFLYFRFKNDTDFEMLYVTSDFKSEEFKEYQEIRRNGFRAYLPSAVVGLDKNYQLNFEYDDAIVYFDLNLTTNELMSHSLKEALRETKSLNEEFLELVKLLKNK